MKISIFFTLVTISPLLLSASFTSNSCFDNNDIETVIQELYEEVIAVRTTFNRDQLLVSYRQKQLRKRIQSELSTEIKLACNIQWQFLKEYSSKLRKEERIEISKIRYIKGLQIIKILYEKMLALDHHFSSVVTLNEINKMGNPNNYTEFEKIKHRLGDKKDRRSGLELTEILGQNIYTSVAHSLISLFTDTNTAKSEKKKRLSDIECILDFTLRMHTELNTIYFETAYLQKSNDNILAELETLFEDFTEPIEYHQNLQLCRSADDWGTIRDYLNLYIQELNFMIDANERKARLMQIDLEFPIDRLLQFIIKYNAFIDQGAKFYEKFGIMLESYENQKVCAPDIPKTFQLLKENIAIAIEKFQTTYKPVEINGSKMKEVLYGINEYD